MPFPRRYIPLLFPASVLVMMAIAGLWPREANFGPVMILAGCLAIVYSVWRYRNPDWWHDSYWARHDRLREWLRATVFPRFIRRRMSEQRREQLDGIFGVVWGLGGIAIGVAQLAGAFPG